MKFEAKIIKRDPQDAKAFLDEDGDLIILDKQAGRCTEHVCLLQEGSVTKYDDATVAASKRVQCFFPGDTITITF